MGDVSQVTWMQQRDFGSVSDVYDVFIWKNLLNHTSEGANKLPLTYEQYSPIISTRDFAYPPTMLQ